MGRAARKWLALLPAVVLAATLAGCTSIGVQRVGIDRTDYTRQLRQSDKEQLLANIVALRHGDAPMFLEVSSVISQYSRESTGELRISSGDFELHVVRTPAPSPAPPDATTPAA